MDKDPIKALTSPYSLLTKTEVTEDESDFVVLVESHRVRNV